jgi:phosphoglycerate dehydrogenase-like enzyme
VGLRELFAQSDGVCVLLTYFTRYHGLLGERFLEHCKLNQVLVSVAHSSLFDTDALAYALATGRIAGAWFDSMEPGMLDPGRALHGIDTIQITPRVAGTTRESRIRSAWTVARRIDLILQPMTARGTVSERLPGDLADLAGDAGPG